MLERLRQARFIWKLAAALALVVSALAATLSFEVGRLMAVTEPEQAGAPSWGKRKALVLLDVQEEYTGTQAQPPFPYAGSSELLERINGCRSEPVRGRRRGLPATDLHGSLSKLVTLLLLAIGDCRQSRSRARSATARGFLERILQTTRRRLLEQAFAVRRPPPAR